MVVLGGGVDHGRAGSHRLCRWKRFVCGPGDASQNEGVRSESDLLDTQGDMQRYFVRLKTHFISISVSLSNRTWGNSLGPSPWMRIGRLSALPESTCVRRAGKWARGGRETVSAKGSPMACVMRRPTVDGCDYHKT